MATYIGSKAGGYFSDMEPEEVKAAIDRGDFIAVWWYSISGQRYRERAWFAPEAIDLIRSEHDDG